MERNLEGPVFPHLEDKDSIYRKPGAKYDERGMLVAKIRGMMVILGLMRDPRA